MESDDEILLRRHGRDPDSLLAAAEFARKLSAAAGEGGGVDKERRSEKPVPASQKRNGDFVWGDDEGAAAPEDPLAGLSRSQKRAVMARYKSLRAKLRKLLSSDEPLAPEAAREALSRHRDGSASASTE
eukprot:gene14082-21558_t